MAFLLSALLAGGAAPVLAQTGSDRINPTVVTPDLTAPLDPRRSPAPSLGALATEQAQTIQSTIGTMVGAIRVEGAQTLTAADFAPAIEPWLGRELDQNALQALATAIAEIARTRGYVFARADIPEQTLKNGVLRVRIDEGRVDQVVIEGDDRARVSALLAKLVNDRPVTRAALERGLLIVGDVPGVTVGSVRLRRDAGSNILIVPIAFNAMSARIDIDNRGTERIGPLRTRLGLTFAGLAVAHDELTVDGAAALPSLKELQVVSASYSANLRASGTRLGVSGYYAHIAARSTSGGSPIQGNSYEFAAEVRQPLLRSSAAQISAYGTFALRRSHQRSDLRLLRRDNVSLASLGIVTSGTALGGSFRGVVTTHYGLDLFDASRRGDQLNSRRAASGVFDLWTARFDWSRAVSRSVKIRLSSAAQVTDKPLLIGEKFAIGGARFLRGYDYGERLGDEGAAGSIELALNPRIQNKLIGRAELYAFGDTGFVRDQGRNARSLASAGGGIRIAIDRRFSASGEVAVPLTGAREEGNTRRPRLSFTLTAIF